MSTPATRPASPRARRAYSTAAASAPLMVAALLAGTAPAQAAHPDAPGSPLQPDSRPAPAPGPTAPLEAAAAPVTEAPQLPFVVDVPGFTSGTTTAAVPVSHGGRTYQVRTGDTVISIAAKHGVSAPALLELNRLRGKADVRPGQVLSLPEQASVPAPAGHRVRPGDTLAAIAQRHGTTVPALQRANAMGTSTVLRTGELLALSGTGASSQRPSPPAVTDLPHLPRAFEGRAYPAAVHTAARINKQTLAARPAPHRTEITALVASIARQLGVDPSLALAVAQQESGFNQRVVSPANAIGVMQVSPAAGAWAGQLAGRDLDILDAADNITAGTAILRWLTRTADSESQALAGYYQGLSSVQENGPYADTRRYVRAVQVQKDRFRTQEQKS